MVIHKIWTAETKRPSGRVSEERTKEGWFLFGFIPLFVRTMKLTTFN